MRSKWNRWLNMEVSTSESYAKTVRESEFLDSTQSDAEGCRHYTVRTFRSLCFQGELIWSTSFTCTFWALTLVVFDDVTWDNCSWTFKPTSLGCTLWAPLLMYKKFHHLQVIFVCNPHGQSIMHNFVHSAIFHHVELAAYVVT